MSEPNPELLAEIDREKHERARQMTPLERLLVGPKLYDAFLSRYAAGLRAQHPDATEEEILQMVFDCVEKLQQRDRPDEYP